MFSLANVPGAGVLVAMATVVTLVAAGGVLQFQEHEVATPTAWFNTWFASPALDHVILSAPPSERWKQLFGYAEHNGPDLWALDFPTCAGYRQSPIDLDAASMLKLFVDDALRWSGYWRRPQNMSVTNTGHTIQLSGSWADDETPSVSGGPLEGEYLFGQLHFHWGSEDDIGSEHTVHNVSFPLEMHVVHYRREFDNVEAAMQVEGGIAVVSNLFRISDGPNVRLAGILGAVHAVRGAELRVELPDPFALDELVLPFERDYVTYSGSLTTPPCNEVVTWLVSSRPLPISSTQLEEFRSFNSFDGNMENNFRPVQPRNGRPVFYVS